MKKLLLAMGLVLGMPLLYAGEKQLTSYRVKHGWGSGTLSKEFMHSYALVGKDEAKIYLIERDAYKTSHFIRLINGVKNVCGPCQFVLRLPHASKNDLKHIELYAGIRSAWQNDMYEQQEMMSNYSNGLTGDELLNLVKSARLLFDNESVPRFLLAPLCARVEKEDKTFPYSQLPEEVQDAIIKMLLSRMEKRRFSKEINEG